MVTIDILKELTYYRTSHKQQTIRDIFDDMSDFLDFTWDPKLCPKIDMPGAGIQDYVSAGGGHKRIQSILWANVKESDYYMLIAQTTNLNDKNELSGKSDFDFILYYPKTNAMPVTTHRATQLCTYLEVFDDFVKPARTALEKTVYN